MSNYEIIQIIGILIIAAIIFYALYEENKTGKIPKTH